MKYIVEIELTRELTWDDANKAVDSTGVIGHHLCSTESSLEWDLAFKGDKSEVIGKMTVSTYEDFMDKKGER